jgi:hypothetical protein
MSKLWWNVSHKAPFQMSRSWQDCSLPPFQSLKNSNNNLDICVSIVWINQICGQSFGTIHLWVILQEWKFSSMNSSESYSQQKSSHISIICLNKSLRTLDLGQSVQTSRLYGQWRSSEDSMTERISGKWKHICPILLKGEANYFDKTWTA